jgi:CheY-like chemotaxis protein
MALESDIRAFAKAKGRPLKVLVVDDEAIYRSALASSLGRTPELTSAITVLEAQDGDEGLAKLSTNPDLIVTDVDMGHQTDGFDFVEAARQAGFTGLICIHSNRMVAKDHRAAFEKGADAFIPKPMARAQLLKLVLQAAQESQLIVHQLPATISTAKPEILVVEDNPFILEVWQQTLQDEATVYGITSFEALNERLESDPGFATRLLLAITDMHLDGSAGDGLAVGRLLKKHRPELRVLLSSDGVISPHELIGAIDVTIGKNPVGLAALSRF